MPPYRLVRDFLPPPTPGHLLDWAIGNEAEFTPTVVDYQQQNGQDPTVRVSLGVRKFGPLEAMLREHVLKIAPVLIEELRVSLSGISRVELEFVAHNDGAFFTRHIDTETGARWAADGIRFLSGVYYLHHQPKAFTGGCLRLFPFGGDGRQEAFVDVEPEHNTLVVFPSWVAHEVRPIHCPSKRFAHSRFAINIWLRAAPPASTDVHD